MSIARPIESHRGLVETCRQRALDLAISRQELDRLAGLPDGYSGKLLSYEGHSKDPRRMWSFAFEAMLGALGLQVIIIEDPAATARTLARREKPVNASQQRFGNVSRISATLLPPPQTDSPPALSIEASRVPPPIASRAHLRVIQPKKKGRVSVNRSGRSSGCAVQAILDAAPASGPR